MEYKGTRRMLMVEESTQLLRAIFPNYPDLTPINPAPDFQIPDEVNDEHATSDTPVNHSE